MPRFYFNLFNNLTSIDDEGVELPDRATARERAIRSVREVAAADVLEGHLNLSHRIDIVDQEGQRIETVTFGDAVEVES